MNSFRLSIVEALQLLRCSDRRLHRRYWGL
jgi:hypothetical protein